MPARQHKPVEADDGSYGGAVLAAFDDLERQRERARLRSWRAELVAGLGEGLLQDQVLRGAIAQIDVDLILLGATEEQPKC